MGLPCIGGPEAEDPLGNLEELARENVPSIRGSFGRVGMGTHYVKKRWGLDHPSVADMLTWNGLKMGITHSGAHLTITEGSCVCCL